MRIREFTDKYCSDLVATSKQKKSLLDSDEFTYDRIIYDPDGAPVKVVCAGDTDIPIVDILTLGKDEFSKIYPSIDAIEAYDSYIEGIVVLEGEEALAHIRNEIVRERERIQKFEEFIDAV